MAAISGPAAAQAPAPVIVFLSPTSAAAGDPPFTLTVTGLNFTVGSAIIWNSTPLPTSFGGINVLTATVPTSLLSAAGSVAVSVYNPDGQRSNGAVFTVQAPPISITTSVLPAAAVGSPYSATLTASGGLAPYVWIAVDPLPQGLSLSSTGTIAGTPSQSGEYVFNVRVLDASQRAAVKALSLSVSQPPLSIRSDPAPPAGTVGVAYTHTFAVDRGTPPVRWSVSAGLPPGLTLNTSTGVLSGTPTTRGTYTFTVQAVDNANVTANRQFTITIQAPPLAITTVSPLFNGSVGAPYSQTFAASGGTPPYVWSMQPAVPGLTLDPNTGALTGTPQSAATTTLNVQVRDADGRTVSKSFALTIEAPRITIITGSGLPDAAVGVTYSVRLTATGGTAPYTWTLLSGAVPGLSLDPSGILGNVPSQPGTFTLSIQARDAAGLTATKSFTITVAPGALSVTPRSEPFTATVAQPFSQTLQASGGLPPYTWTANGLPEGLTLDSATGVVSGSPRVGGALLFTARVTDSTRASATELFQITIAYPPVPAIVPRDLPQQIAAAEQPSFGISLQAPYAVALTGELLLTFVPDSGQGDPSIQFSTGGRTLPFTVPAGSTEPQFAASPLAFQTGSVAGNIVLTARLQSNGINLTANPVPVASVRVERAAPVITSATFTRTQGGLEIQVTGYSTAKEITQATFRFSAASGSTLQNSEVTVSVENLFTGWFSDAGSAGYGSQFTYTQTFSVQGDVNAVTPVSLTLTNRVGSTRADIR